MNLIIVESPTKARTLGKFLGSSYVVEATTGHIKDLPKSKLGIDIENNFEPTFEEVEKRKATIKLLKSSAKKAENIFIASDPDREGEAIAQHVYEIVGNKNTKRITFHEITKKAVEEAITHPTTINKPLVDAMKARRVLDRLVGYKLSPLLWKKVRRGLSAGRVQSVAVRLIVEKEREIEKFKPEEYWEIFAEVIQSISNRVNQKEKFKIQLIKQEVTNEKDAKLIVAELQGSHYSVKDVKKKSVNKSPYPPFTTSTLTQAGSRIFGWSSKRTMSIAQKLYEEGLITYHRTDSLNLNGEAVEAARLFIRKEYGEKYLPEKPKFYKTNSKNAQEAHEAIRPTDSTQYEVLSTQLEPDNKKLYELIWKRFLACQMNPAIYSETVIDVEAKYMPGVYLLRASGQIMIFDGWRKLFPIDKDIVILPEIEKGEDLDLIKVDSFQKFTQPPARYNEASLIKTLEKLGIGRPSTYAPTINTIQVRAYVEKNENKNFVPTSVGIAVNDFLIGNFPETFDYQFTAKMESDLDEIANNKFEWQKPIKEFYKPFEKKLVDVEKNSQRVKIETEKLGRKCPDCSEGELVIRMGRFGKFISCDRFPECKHTEKLIEKIDMKCPDCNEGDIVRKKTKKGRFFFGCSRYPDCKFASWKKPTNN